MLRAVSIAAAEANVVLGKPYEGSTGPVLLHRKVRKHEVVRFRIEQVTRTHATANSVLSHSRLWTNAPFSTPASNEPFLLNSYAFKRRGIKVKKARLIMARFASASQQGS